VLAEFMVPWRWEDITAKQLKADPGNAAGYILVPKTSMLLLASLIILQISNSNLCPDVFYESQQLERMKTHCRCCTMLAFVKFHLCNCNLCAFGWLLQNEKIAEVVS
jgi:hypothetical protein